MIYYKSKKEIKFKRTALSSLTRRWQNKKGHRDLIDQTRTKRASEYGQEMSQSKITIGSIRETCLGCM